MLLDKETVGSRYLLLHTSGNTNSGDLWKIVSKGPRVFSEEDMIKKDYPSPKGSYLIFQIEKVTDSAFKDVQWDFRKLIGFTIGRGSGLPFTTSLSELMRVKVTS